MTDQHRTIVLPSTEGGYFAMCALDECSFLGDPRPTLEDAQADATMHGRLLERDEAADFLQTIAMAMASLEWRRFRLPPSFAERELPEPLTTAGLDAIGCIDHPGAPHALSGQCHIDAGVKAVYNAGVLTFTCNECEAFICQVRVAKPAPERLTG